MQSCVNCCILISPSILVENIFGYILALRGQRVEKIERGHVML